MDDPGRQRAILICVNTRLSSAAPSCGGRASQRLIGLLQAAAAARGQGLTVHTQLCFGRCAEGPNLRFYPGGPFYRGVTPAQVTDILDAFQAWCETGSGGAPSGG